MVSELQQPRPQTPDLTYKPGEPVKRFTQIYLHFSSFSKKVRESLRAIYLRIRCETHGQPTVAFFRGLALTCVQRGPPGATPRAREARKEGPAGETREVP